MADDFTFSDYSATSRTAAADDVGSKLYPWVKMAAGADNTATPAVTTNVSATFNRPSGGTGSYVSGDSIANSATAGSVTPLSWTIAAGAGIIRRVRVRKSDQAVATPTIRVFLFTTSPTVGSGDDAVWSNPLAACFGYVDVAVTTAGSDDAVGWTNVDIPFAAGTVYGLLQSRSTFTGADGETFTVDMTYIPG